MADIQYLNYGDLQIEQLALMNKLSDNVVQYVNSQPWSTRKKERFMNAYSDIMNKGLKGASNGTGRWMIETGGPLMDFNSMSRQDRESYELAAYFILLLMSSLPTKSKVEELKKSELTPYDGNTFTNGFLLHVYNQMSNGLPLIIGGEDDLWNYLDKRKENGERGRTERAKLLAKLLKEYSDTVTADKYSFEGGPFKDINDFKARINEAIAALNTNDISDDKPALLRLGIKESTWFNNGSGDPFKTEGYEGTYGDYYNNYLPKLLKAKNDAILAKQKQEDANRFKRFRFHTGTPASLQDLSKYPDVLGLLSGYGATGAQLTLQQKNELIGAFKAAELNGQLLNLSKEELARFGSGYANSPTRLKKLKGLEGFYWDSIGNRVIQPFTERENSMAFLDLVNLNNPLKLLELKKNLLIQSMNEPILGSLDLTDLSNFGFDEATGNELWAVLNDIGAFVNPEAVTGTAMALNAARLRDKNREGWSWERVLDWGTSALGGLPVIGDVASVIKAGSNLVKLANRSARVGSFIGMAFSAVNMPDAWDSIKKIYDKGITSMTPQDILNITYGLMGLFAGIKTINAVNARQKPQTTTEYSIEIDKNKNKRIILPDETVAAKVSNEYKSAKNNTEASQNVLKMLEVRDAAKKAGIEITDASKVTSGSGFLRGNLVSRKLGMAKSPVKQKTVSTGEMIGGSTGGYYMNPLRRWFLGRNPNININNPLKRGYNWFMGETPEIKPTKPIETSKPTAETPKGETNSKKSWSEIEKGEKQWTMDDSMKEWKNILKGELKPLAIGENFKAGNFHFNIMGHSGSSEKGIVEINFGSKKESIKFENLKDLRKKVFKFMKENAPKITTDGKSKYDAKEMGEILKLLKAKGVFKQGGTIDKQKIQKYKNFINK